MERKQKCNKIKIKVGFYLPKIHDNNGRKVFTRYKLTIWSKWTL